MVNNMNKLKYIFLALILLFNYGEAISEELKPSNGKPKTDSMTVYDPEVFRGKGTGMGPGRAKNRKQQGLKMVDVDKVIADAKINRGGPKAGGGERIRVYASPNTSELLSLMTLFFKKKYDVTFELKYATQDELEKLLKQKTPDILISNENNLITSFRKNNTFKSEYGFYHDTLSVIVPKGSKLQIKKPSDLADKNITKIGIATPNGINTIANVGKAFSDANTWKIVQSNFKEFKDTDELLKTFSKNKLDAAIVVNSFYKPSDSFKTVYNFLDDELNPLKVPIILINPKEKKMAKAFHSFFNSHFSDKFFKKFGFRSSWQDEYNKGLAENYKAKRK